MKRLVLAMLLAGCADDVIMDKRGVPTAERQKDHYECLRDSYATGDARIDQYGGVKRQSNGEIYAACLAARGYVRVK